MRPASDPAVEGATPPTAGFLRPMPILEEQREEDALDWNPRSSRSWANLLGLVDVPLFEDGANGVPPGAILLDGQRGTFAFFDVSEGEGAIDDEMLSWAWSANALHTVAVDSRKNQLHVNRWDTERSRTIRIPTKGLAAERLFRSLEDSPKARAATVIQHVLDGFRLIRQALPESASLQAVQVLNSFLLVAARAMNDTDLRLRFEQASVYDDVLSLLDPADLEFVGCEDRSLLQGEAVGALPQYFLGPEPRTGCQLDPILLFRHATTELYQEAHLDLERSPQSYFAGLAPIDRPTGTPPKDVRFTPANLARVLVEQAMDAFGPLPEKLVVLDPACGSGVFLQQCLRELTRRSFEGNVTLHGYDISPIASCISRFCLSGPVRDTLSHQLNADVDIHSDNALRRDTWPDAHLVLMNPPFVSRNSLTEEQLADVNETLGKELARGRVDMAMAFIWRAVNCLRHGGVLATVLPTALLENEWGGAWRNAIADMCEVHLLGRFEGYKYFSTSLVETAFVVLRRTATPPTQTKSTISVLVAREGREDAAIRYLRLSDKQVRRDADGVDFYRASASRVLGDRWTPLRQDHFLLREWTQSCELQKLGNLFSVNQGIRTRYKPAFVLDAAAYDQLPKSERAYFRPAAGQTSIVDGRLHKHEYVFYPYDEAGLRIETESQLNSRLPVYVGEFLNRHRSRLGDGQWWALIRPGNWQWKPEQKLVAKTYGTTGDFAYDDTGDYAVLQGCAWRWRIPGPRNFVSDSLQLAYLALFNSSVFGVLLSVYCRRVQGGQFELANKYVAAIPMPDLTRDDATTLAAMDKLARYGQTIHGEGLSALGRGLDEVVASAYGLPSDISDAFQRAAGGIENAHRP